jgi:hypothetical protein
LKAATAKGETMTDDEKRSELLRRLAKLDQMIQEVDNSMPEREASRDLRYARSEMTRRYYAPGDVQTSAETIRDCLSVPRYNESLEST